jgi:hypothetical protein
MADLVKQLVRAVRENPAATQAQLAEAAGVDRITVAKTLISDEFQLALAGGADGASDSAKLQTLMNRAIDVLADKLKRQPDYVSDTLAAKVLELCMKGLNIGAEGRPSLPAGEMHIHLEVLGENLVRLLERKRGSARLIEGEASETIQ